jgi:membrane protein YdbS with pleckstrin-like domain
LFLITGLSGVIALAGSIALGIRMGAENGDAGGAFVGFIAAVLINLAWLIPALLVIPPYYRSLQYEIHDDEVIVRAGVITKTVKHVPFRTVTNVEVKQGPFDRLFGIGTLKIQTAGMSGQSGAEESLGGLSNFQQVYDQIATELRRYRGAMAPTQA